MRALVTGATGFVGSYLVAALSEKDWTVRCLVRSAPRAECLTRLPGVEAVEGDLTKPETLEGMADDVDLVFHLAAEGHISAQSEEAYRRFHLVNVEGTRNLIKACAGQSVSKFVHFSSTAAMGLIRNARTSEEDEPRPATPYQKSKRASELVALEAGREFGIPLVVLRPCMIYGIGGKGEFHKMCTLMRKGRFPRVGRGRNLTPLVHVKDVVRATALAAEKGHPGEIYLVASEHSIPLSEMRNLAMEAWGTQAAYPYVPAWAMYTAAWVFETIGRLTGKAPLATRRNIASTAWDREFSIEKAKNDLGYEPSVPFREGILETVEWFKTL
ncbi:NAD-dependent epimerase/dehydratase family protein [bacterium]|nr:NAD-dependent epimerase/dehydratase family protein [bacterium]